MSSPDPYDTGSPGRDPVLYSPDQYDVAPWPPPPEEEEPAKDQQQQSQLFTSQLKQQQKSTTSTATAATAAAAAAASISQGHDNNATAALTKRTLSLAALDTVGASEEEDRVHRGGKKEGTRSSPSIPPPPPSVIDGIRVVVRVRPASTEESANGETSAVTCMEDSQTLALVTSKAEHPKSFTFHRVLAPGGSQENMFEGSGVKHLLDSALEGYACTAFAFGQTGSGKTHTMTGPEVSAAGGIAAGGGGGGGGGGAAAAAGVDTGLIQRSVQYLWDARARRPDVSYTFSASYLESYNEQVNDLLNQTGIRQALPVRWQAGRGFYVENLYTVRCSSLDDIVRVLEEGLRQRSVAAHEMNERSSRSHSILTIHIASDVPNNMLTSENNNNNNNNNNSGGGGGGGGGLEYENDETLAAAGMDVLHRKGSISFVDLAGSERVSRTKAKGDTLVESHNINKSLLTLGNCISALADPRKRAGHIPYRESTLTMLLKDSLGGTGKTLMIACVAPGASSTMETHNTLRYASRAKRIQNKPIMHVDAQQQLVLALRREVRMLRTECGYLRKQVDSGRDVLGTPASVIRLADSLGTAVPIDSESQRSMAAMTSELTQMRVLLQQYMQENEELRHENMLLLGREHVFQRQHEVVLRENQQMHRQLTTDDYRQRQHGVPDRGLARAQDHGHGRHHYLQHQQQHQQQQQQQHQQRQIRQVAIDRVDDSTLDAEYFMEVAAALPSNSQATVNDLDSAYASAGMQTNLISGRGEKQVQTQMQQQQQEQKQKQQKQKQQKGRQDRQGLGRATRPGRRGKEKKGSGGNGRDTSEGGQGYGAKAAAAAAAAAVSSSKGKDPRRAGGGGTLSRKKEKKGRAAWRKAATMAKAVGSYGGGGGAGGGGGGGGRSKPKTMGYAALAARAAYRAGKFANKHNNNSKKTPLGVPDDLPEGYYTGPTSPVMRTGKYGAGPMADDLSRLDMELEREARQYASSLV